MSSTNDVIPSTPTEKLSKLTSDITKILQDLSNNMNSPASPSRQPSTSGQTDRITEILHYFQQQQDKIQKIINTTSPDGISQSNVYSIRTPVSPTNRSGKPSASSLPEYYNNAKYEDIICRPIKPLYDGSPEQLVPFLNRLVIRRQDEGWYPITFLTIQHQTYDLIRHFAKLDESIMLTEAKLRWHSPTVMTDKHSIDHPTYNARVLARLLLRSVTDDFSITIINRIPQDYHNDGPLILWMICSNIHRNNIAFIETIKTKIRESNVSQFGDDICKYIIHIKDNLCLITTADTSSEHNDLLTHILLQLCASPIKPFKEAMQQVHVDYLEAKLPNITPLTLLKQADNKAQILKHAGQWKDTETSAVMALQSALDQQKAESTKLMQHIVAHLRKFANNRPYRPQQHNVNDPNFIPNQSNKRPYHNDYENNSQRPAWMTIAPMNPNDTKVVDRRVYSWCTKCHQGIGLWVSHHNTITHVNGYRNNHRRLENNRRINLANASNQNPGQDSQKFSVMDGQNIHNTDNIPQNPGAQLSILDYLDSYLPQDETASDPDNCVDD
jgi:hypothetical protein